MKFNKERFLALYAKGKAGSGLDQDEQKELETLRCSADEQAAVERASITAAAVTGVEVKDNSDDETNRILCDIEKSSNVLAPAGFAGSVWQDMSGQSQLLSLLDGAGAIYHPDNLEDFPVPYISDSVSAVATAEGDFVTTDDGQSGGTVLASPTNSQIVLGANYWQTGHIKVSNKFRRGSSFDVLAEIRKVTAKRINARIRTVLASLVKTLSTKTVEIATDSLVKASLDAMLGRMPGEYSGNSVWVMARETGSNIDGLVVGDNQPFNVLGGATLKGLPVIWLDEMGSTFTNGDKPIALINVADCIVGRITPAEDIKVITELYSANDETAYQYGVYGDFKVKENNAGVLLRVTS